MRLKTLLIDDGCAEGTKLFAVRLDTPRVDIEQQLYLAHLEHRRTGQLFLFTFAGMQDETRQLNDIPEARIKANELLDTGIGGILEYTTTVPSRASDFVKSHGLLGGHYGFGFFELLALASGAFDCKVVSSRVLELCDQGLLIQRGICELLRKRLSGELN